MSQEIGIYSAASSLGFGGHCSRNSCHDSLHAAMMLSALACRRCRALEPPAYDATSARTQWYLVQCSSTKGVRVLLLAVGDLVDFVPVSDTIDRTREVGLYITDICGVYQRVSQANRIIDRIIEYHDITMRGSIE